ncbi:MAG TPA: GNAT family N-acetyltransferase [Terriglobales bacterium]|nr:GNAT family N-acetyltransferase [Terriglobales bacterium]
MSELEVVSATEADAPAWDQLVAQNPEGRFSHLWGFRRILENTYGYRCVYLKICSEGRLVGVFPSIVARSSRLVSQPFIEYGGPLLRGVSEAQQAHLAELLLRAAQNHGCHSLEIRGGLGAQFLATSPYCVRRPLYSYAVLNLGETDRLWRKSLTNEARKGVNKAQKAGLQSEVRHGKLSVADPFYALYLASMKRLGVPPHPRHFFDELAAGLGDGLVASWVTHEQQTVAVLLGAICGARLQIYITTPSPKMLSLRPNDLAHWQLIAWAAEQGLLWFDFGSARYEGQIQFKKKWGVGLHDYAYYLIGAPDTSANTKIRTVQTSSTSIQIMAKLWSRLVPLRLTPVLGAGIRRYLTK